MKKNSIDVVMSLTPSELVLLDWILRREFQVLKMIRAVDLSQNLDDVRQSVLLDNLQNIREQLPQGVIALLKRDYKDHADILKSPLFQKQNPGSGCCTPEETATGMLVTIERKVNEYLSPATKLLGECESSGCSSAEESAT